MHDVELLLEVTMEYTETSGAIESRVNTSMETYFEKLLFRDIGLLFGK